MIRELQQRLADVGDLCRTYQVEELHLFGSATAATDISEVGDLDFLVRFKRVPPVRYAANYFGLMESLAALFSKPVDLVEEIALANPYFKTAVDERKVRIYHAA